MPGNSKGRWSGGHDYSGSSIHTKVSKADIERDDMLATLNRAIAIHMQQSQGTNGSRLKSNLLNLLRLTFVLLGNRRQVENGCCGRKMFPSRPPVKAPNALNADKHSLFSSLNSRANSTNLYIRN